MWNTAEWKFRTCTSITSAKRYFTCGNESKNMCDANSNPVEIFQTVNRKSVAKDNGKLRADINFESRYETLYLKDSGDANITIFLQYKKYW